MKKNLLGIVLILVYSVILAGCTSIQKIGSTVTAQVENSGCTKHEQVGCFELQMLNLQFDARHQLMRGLEVVPASSQEERVRRVKTLAPDLLRAYERGEVKAASPDGYEIFLWKIDTSVSMDKMASWRLNGMQVSKGVVEDVTSTVAPPVLSLGKPDRVYRVQATGEKAAAVSFQAPWSLYTKDSVIMIKSIRHTVYPGEGNALWIMPKYLNDTIRAQNWKWALLAFLHGKDGSVSGLHGDTPLVKK